MRSLDYVVNKLTYFTANANSDPKHNAREETATSNDADWIQEIIATSEKDTRKQPWKSTFNTPVDFGFDDGRDLVTVKKRAGTSDPSCPFNTQGSSLAA